MSQFEDRLTDLLVRSADAVEVRPDLDRVLLDAGSEIPLARQPEPQRRHLHRRRRLALAATVAAAACVIAAVVVVTGGDSRRTAEVGPSSASTETSTDAGSSINVPRFLVTAPGWEIVHVREAHGDEYGGYVGEMKLSNASGWVVSLNWYPAEQYDDFVADRLGDGVSTPILVDGREAQLTGVSGRSLSSLWLDGDATFELRGDGLSLDEYQGLVASVREVDQATWLAALPDDVVRPDDRRAAIEDTLAELPVPGGLDVDALIGTGTANDASTVEMEVLDAVICGWVQQWVDGTGSGDTPAAAEAADAMASSGEWPPMVDTASGTYAAFVEDVADAMATGVALEQSPDLPPGTGYQRHLGCPEG